MVRAGTVYSAHMAHHAYVAEGTQEEALAAARDFAAARLGLSGSSNPDLVVLSFGLFSVEDARRVADAAYASALGAQKAVIIYAGRLFHEAQNALLKVFEEPPAGVTLILCVPSAGILLPTLRSRLVPLPTESVTPSDEAPVAAAHAFLALGGTEREKHVAKLLERAKSDKDEQKQAARSEAAELIAGLTAVAHDAWERAGTAGKREELRTFLADLSAFMPLMYERSAPLKLVFEHLLLTIPRGLEGGRKATV